MSASRTIEVVLKVRKANAPHFLVVSQAVLAGITAHLGLFPGLPVSVALLAQQVQALDALQQQVRQRIPGAAAARDLAREELFVSVEAIRVHVQGLCNLNPEQSQTLVQAAGLRVAAGRVHQKPMLDVKQGAASGAVKLLANATLLPATPYARTSVDGLPVLAVAQFRVCLVTDTVGPWSQAVSFLVH
jgi:hypothetical protein